jgi:hypothetical protein
MVFTTRLLQCSAGSVSIYINGVREEVLTGVGSSIVILVRAFIWEPQKLGRVVWGLLKWDG